MKDVALQRRPSFDPALMTDRQRRVFDAIKAGPRGVVRGPFEVWMHNPGLAEHAQALGAYCRFGTVLPPRLSELAIIVTAAHWRANYEWRSHAPKAIEGGLPEHVVESIRRGTPPEFVKQDEAAVHRFASELLQHHRVSTEIWDLTLELIGTQGVVDLVGLLGYYVLVSMTIVAFEIGHPELAADVFERD